MFIVYKTAAPDEIDRVIAYCRTHTTKNGGFFEVYPSPEGEMRLILINTCPKDGAVDTRQPLGAFYCNYLAPGVVAVEDSPHDGPAESKRSVQAVKQVIDILFAEESPETALRQILSRQQ